MTEAQVGSSDLQIGVETARCLMSALGPTLRAVVVAVLGTLSMTLGLASAGGAAPIAPVPTPGYWLVGADGGVFSFNAPFFGSGASACAASYMGSPGPYFCASAISSTPDGGGYTLLTPYGFSGFGEQEQPAIAMQFGNASGNASCAQHFSAAGGAGTFPFGSVTPWVDVASSPSNQGIWLLSAGGVVATCGDASYYGEPDLLNGSVPGPGFFFPDAVGISATPDGKGYWVAAADGGVFAYGDAGFYGSMGGKQLNNPIVGIAATPDGKGYWLVASDGGIFAFGDASFFGSMGGQPLNAPMVGIAANPDGPGYWTVAFDGGVFAFGGAPFEGSMGSQILNGPILGIASRAG
jgi:hypothetical protein